MIALVLVLNFVLMIVLFPALKFVLMSVMLNFVHMIVPFLVLHLALMSFKVMTNQSRKNRLMNSYLQPVLMFGKFCAHDCAFSGAEFYAHDCALSGAKVCAYDCACSGAKGCYRFNPLGLQILVLILPVR